MTPEYLNQLADLADPDQLWRPCGLDQMKLPPDKRRQLDHARLLSYKTPIAPRRPH